MEEKSKRCARYYISVPSYTGDDTLEREVRDAISPINRKAILATDLEKAVSWLYCKIEKACSKHPDHKSPVMERIDFEREIDYEIFDAVEFLFYPDNRGDSEAVVITFRPCLDLEF